MISANIPNELRRTVYRRDDYACALCNDTRHLQIHHGIPRSHGGKNNITNLITLCGNCHAMAHGADLNGTGITADEVELAVIEYLSELYADRFAPFENEDYAP
jgi:predicted restriction endonuclease